MPIRGLAALLAAALLIGGAGWLLFAWSEDAAYTQIPAGPEDAAPEPPAPDPMSVAEPVAANRSLEHTGASGPAPEAGPANGSEADRGDPKAAAPHGIVVGTVVDVRGAYLADVKVQCRQRGDATATTGADGAFVLELELSRSRLSDSFTLEFRRPGFGTLALEANVAAGGTTALGVIQMSSAGRITGLVLDAQSRPRAEAEVAVEEATSRATSSRFQGPRSALIRARTGADGLFALEDVPAGEVRVWAGGEGLAWVSSEVLTVRADQPIQGLTLQVLPLDPEDTIVLTVVDPQDRPVPGARVRYWYKLGGGSGSGSTSADPQGVVTQFMNPRCPHWFEATDPAGQYRPAIADGVEPGTHDLVLKLGVPRHFEVAVHDGSTPVRSYRVHLSEVEPQRALGQALKDPVITEGVARVMLPTVPFLVRVSAEGYEVAEAGPFEPEDAPARLEVALTRLAAVHGRVVHGTAGVAGATVGVHEAVRPDGWLTVNGFPSRAERFAMVRATTDADGHFELAVRDAGQYYLRAEASGFCGGELGPVELDPARGATDLVIELCEGGAIEGRLLAPPGVEVVGRILGFSRGDGQGFTRRTDARGHYRVEGLLPGEWLIEPREEEISTRSTSSSSSSVDEPRDLPFSCVVAEGRTTYFDLNLGDLYAATVQGRVRFSGEPAQGWQVTFSSRDEPGRDWQSGLEAGEFSVSLPGLGPHVVQLRGTVSGASHVLLRDLVEVVAGPQVWELDLPVGGLTGRCDSTRVLVAAGVDVTYSDGRRNFHAALPVAADGTFALPLAPAGECQVRYELLGDRSESSPVTIVEGRTATLDIP